MVEGSVSGRSGPTSIMGASERCERWGKTTTGWTLTVWGERSAKGSKLPPMKNSHIATSASEGLSISILRHRRTVAQREQRPAAAAQPCSIAPRRSHIRGLPSMNLTHQKQRRLFVKSPAEDLCCQGEISLARSLLQVVIRLLQDNSINSP